MRPSPSSSAPPLDHPLPKYSTSTPMSRFRLAPPLGSLVLYPAPRSCPRPRPRPPLASARKPRSLPPLLPVTCSPSASRPCPPFVPPKKDRIPPSTRPWHALAGWRAGLPAPLSAEKRWMLGTGRCGKSVFVSVHRVSGGRDSVRWGGKEKEDGRECLWLLMGWDEPNGIK